MPGYGFSLSSLGSSDVLVCFAPVSLLLSGVDVFQVCQGSADFSEGLVFSRDFVSCPSLFDVFCELFLWLRFCACIRIPYYFGVWYC